MIPEIQLALPRPITSVHQVEITNYCNLTCVYCTNHILKRPKLFMTDEVFDKTLVLANHYLQAERADWRDSGEVGLGNRPVQELNLAGIGESTLHPKFIDMVLKARKVLGPDVKLVMATNGVSLTEAMVQGVMPANLRFHVSLHRPEKAGLAIQLLKKYECLDAVSADPSLAATNWAGQVNWFVSAEERDCPWLRRGWGFVLADGRVSTCSFDSDGSGVIGTVDTPPEELLSKPYGLCKDCDQIIAIEGYEQYPQRAKDEKKGLPVLP